ELSACRIFSSEAGTMTLLKLSLMAFSIVFWAAGLAMFIIGLWATVFLGSYLELSANSSPSAPAILLATGAVVIIWGFLGCFGAATEHRGLLRLHQALLTYGKDEGMADALDALQRSLSCCGVQSYWDWLTTPWGLEQNGSVPFSCCQARQGCHRSPPDTRGLHHDGCFPKVLAFVSSNMFCIATAALGLALLQLLGIVLACLLAARCIVLQKFLWGFCCELQNEWNGLSVFEAMSLQPECKQRTSGLALLPVVSAGQAALQIYRILGFPAVLTGIWSFRKSEPCTLEGLELSQLHLCFFPLL
uniref:Uncharacterized protein n=1 Tax=Melopsittacus undulatus TaxID=13146 RepID=A0A8V5FLY7_MELUD